MQGPATDLGIEAAHMLRLRDRMYKLMAEWCGKTQEQIHRDFDRNKWLFAEEAVAYGCCDRVLKSAPEAPHRAAEPDSEEKE
jgi:ATP-dependent Clp protease protease subunit